MQQIIYPVCLRDQTPIRNWVLVKKSIKVDLVKTHFNDRVILPEHCAETYNILREFFPQVNDQVWCIGF